MPLRQFRQLFNVISQEVYIFKGTLRDNLNLDQQHGDGELLQCINQVCDQNFINLIYRDKAPPLDFQIDHND